MAQLSRRPLALRIGCSHRPDAVEVPSPLPHAERDRAFLVETSLSSMNVTVGSVPSRTLSMVSPVAMLTMVHVVVRSSSESYERNTRRTSSPCSARRSLSSSSTSTVSGHHGSWWTGRWHAGTIRAATADRPPSSGEAVCAAWVQDSGILFHGQRRSRHNSVATRAVSNSPSPLVSPAGAGRVWSEGR